MLADLRRGLGRRRDAGEFGEGRGFFYDTQARVFDIDREFIRNHLCVIEELGDMRHR